MAKIKIHKKKYVAWQWSSPLYRTWVSLKLRCNNKNTPFYSYYGGRGITYDPKWEKFSEFNKDMSSSYKKGLTIDRIDNNGNYCKKNCRWATKKQQALNRRSTHLFTFNKKSLTFTDWSVEVGIKRSTLAQRFYVNKWPLRKTLTTITGKRTVK